MNTEDNRLEELEVDRREFSRRLGSLRDMWLKDRTAQEVLNYLEQKRLATLDGNKQYKEEVGEVAKALKDSDITRVEIVRFLKAMANQGLGQFITGRHGLESRFEWTLTGLCGNEEPATPDTEEHSFVVRPGFRVAFRLPADFKPMEAVRLADFILTLPFDQGPVLDQVRQELRQKRNELAHTEGDPQ